MRDVVGYVDDGVSVFNGYGKQCASFISITSTAAGLQASLVKQRVIHFLYIGSTC
jgi:hypothetical protein